MKRLITMLLVVTCSTMLMAAGSSGGSNGSNEGMGQKGKISGTVQDVMTQDSMLTINNESGMTDTVKVTDKTKMQGTLDEIKSGDKVDVMYEMVGNQKVAKSIKMSKNNGDGSSQTPDTSGMRDTSGMKSDTMPY